MRKRTARNRATATHSDFITVNSCQYISILCLCRSARVLAETYISQIVSNTHKLIKPNKNHKMGPRERTLSSMCRYYTILSGGRRTRYAKFHYGPPDMVALSPGVPLLQECNAIVRKLFANTNTPWLLEPMSFAPRVDVGVESSQWGEHCKIICSPLRNISIETVNRNRARCSASNHTIGWHAVVIIGWHPKPPEIPRRGGRVFWVVGGSSGYYYLRNWIAPQSRARSTRKSLFGKGQGALALMAHLQ